MPRMPPNIGTTPGRNAQPKAYRKEHRPIWAISPLHQWLGPPRCSTELRLQPKSTPVWERRFDSVARYCLRRLLGRSTDEPVSDVFLTAWQRLDEVPDGDEGLPWLYGAAKYVIRTANHSHRRSQRLSAKVGSRLQNPAPSPEVRVIHSEDAGELVAARKALEPPPSDL